MVVFQVESLFFPCLAAVQWLQIPEHVMKFTKEDSRYPVY